ncbi:MAG: hypothetical protein LPK19_09115 [Hymenobacteraceae bacterium]|nr:hypothetical protein [Hymenobacteraceae bacterium]MDX5396381.1 hypothetical protein [Hymenobacteraceae bacterium]MDX5512443.1 hypothetical protein [Hymenobacteraceae bacterium]
MICLKPFVNIRFVVVAAGIFAASITSVFAQKNSGTFALQQGDLLFQDLDCGPLCDAIEKVTAGHNGSTFSHVGIVVVGSAGKVMVLEAIGDSVQQTPIEKFLARSKDTAGKPKVAVGRLTKEYQHVIPAAIKTAQMLRAKPYDNVFLIDNDAYYCSELVYLAFKDKNNNSLFELNPMTYIDPETKQTFTPWQTYFDNLHTPVPEGLPGINPGGISRSTALKMYYPFGQPDKR